MGISISGSNAISGLSGNDTDFDKVLTQLKQIESTQLNRLEAWKSDWNLRYEAFTQIIEQIQAASSMLSQLADKNNFVTKLVQSSNEHTITAVANASAQDVQHTISVSQVANNAIWANTGHVFESKNDIINTTGTEQYFSYTYAGKRHDFKVPANTTLESFASMFNNSSDNPGLKISIISTGKGYVFQVAGNETGAANDLVIHDSNLVGMDAVNSTSTWLTNGSLNIDEALTDPTSYVYDLVLQNGTKKSVTIKGNATADEVVTALNNAAGGINASVDANGTLTIDGVLSFSRRKADEEPYVPESVRVSLPGDYRANDGTYIKLNATGGLASGMPDGDKLKVTLTLDDDSTREVIIDAGATTRDFYLAIAQATQTGNSVDVGMDKDGRWGVNLSGVKGVTVSDSSGNPLSALSVTNTPANRPNNTLGAQLTSASATLTFNKDKLTSQVDGKTSSDTEDMILTVVLADGTAHNIGGFTNTMSNQDMLDRLQSELTSLGLNPVLGNTADDGSGDITLTIDGVKGITVSSGPTTMAGVTTSIKATTTITATNPSGNGLEDNLFYFDGTNYLAEKAPDLVYTISTNDGRTGTLTLPSGSDMKTVLQHMQNPSGAAWEWKDADGNVLAGADIPTSIGAKFTDADGNEYVDANGNPLALDDIDGPIYLQLDNVQIGSGPGLAGQVASSSNWNIQRSTNAIYKVDNWPVEMESATNTVSDVIEGVIFTIQDVGDARIAVSTDITSVEQSIQNFLDAVNSVLLTVNELMKYDEDKEVTSSDPNDIGNSNYSPSGLTNQKGGLLMGNYGVQLFKSRFTSLITSTPPGFKSQSTADDFLSGDVLAALANMGIKTDTDTTSDTYGLLVMAPSSSIAELQSIDKENYNNMISNNLEAVVDFFCASGIGSSTSSDFRYGSHVEGITQAGTYEVKYTVTPSGEVTNVTVGGIPATRDESQPGYYFSVGSGDPRGLSILIDDLTVGDHPPAGEEPMYVRIKQGLVQTTNQFLKDELVYNDVNITANSTPDQIADAVALKSKNGALMSLRANYKSVMESIDVKIEREQRRIDTWYARQKAIFANLETLLTQYSQQQSSLESQLKQLSGNS